MLIQTTNLDLPQLSEKIKDLYLEGVDNFDIKILDILKFTKDTFAIYEDELLKIASLIINELNASKKIISIDVLTDIFTKRARNKDLKFFIWCRHCPCFQCTPNKEVFKIGTGDEYIPPWQYCEKAFIELRVSRCIVDQLKLPFELANLERKNLDDMINVLYGTTVYGGKLKDGI
jgi:hypothetical protein